MHTFSFLNCSFGTVFHLLFRLSAYFDFFRTRCGNTSFQCSYVCAVPRSCPGSSGTSLRSYHRKVISGPFTIYTCLEGQIYTPLFKKFSLYYTFADFFAFWKPRFQKYLSKLSSFCLCRLLYTKIPSIYLPHILGGKTCIISKEAFDIFPKPHYLTRHSTIYKSFDGQNRTRQIRKFSHSVKPEKPFTMSLVTFFGFARKFFAETFLNLQTSLSLYTVD